MGTWGITRAIAALVTATSVTVAIAGCAPTVDDEARPSPPTSATPSAAPQPAATCETVLSDAQRAKLESEGLVFSGEATGVHSDLQPLVDTGLSCQWAIPSTDIMAWYAQWPSTDEEWESLQARLLDGGYIEIEDPFTGILEAPPDPEYKPALTYRDGMIHYGSGAWLFASVPALQ